jgi:hypothetical protein
MKTIKTKLTALSFAVAMILLTFTTFAAESEMGSNMDLSYFEEYFNLENFTEQLENSLEPEVSIKVYNQEGKLIASGIEKDEKIKSFINISDLLTEVGGTKYYQLSYQTTK